MVPVKHMSESNMKRIDSSAKPIDELHKLHLKGVLVAEYLLQILNGERMGAEGIVFKDLVYAGSKLKAVSMGDGAVFFEKKNGHYELWLS